MPVAAAPSAAVAPIAPANNFVKKEDMEAAISAAVESAMSRIETMISSTLSNTCNVNSPGHFCGKLGHTMSRGHCNTLEQYICLDCVHRGADGKVVLSTGANIPNYSELKSYQEQVDEWHRRNPGNMATGMLTGNVNPDPEQVAQQQLIHKVLHLDSVGYRFGLSKEERITTLETELMALKNQTFDGVKITNPNNH